MRTVKEVSRLTGVSVRTLHHYDAIGLLPPTETTTAGYRLYDDAAMSRLRTILLFRALRFPLKEIKAMLDAPDFDPDEALDRQIHLLELEREHLQGLIDFAREIREKGADYMDFHAFDRSRVEQYAEEVKARWGATDAYREYAEKWAGKEESEQKDAAEGLMALFVELGALRDGPCTDEAVQEKVKALQAYISRNYYTCTDEILRGLGEMYVNDARMRENIDKAAGEGTAAFVREAILHSCNP